MSQRVIYTCERCDADYTDSGPGNVARWTPKTWIVFGRQERYTIGPFNLTGEKREDREADLCEDCCKSLRDWWVGG